MLPTRVLKLILVIQKRFTSNQPNKPIAFDQIPGPKGLPLIGNIWRYFPLIGDYKPDTLFENAQFNYTHYGSLVREKITNKLTVLHLFDPNDIEAFFRQDGKYPFRRSHRALLKYRLDRPEFYLDGGLFPENGPNWHRQRIQFQARLMSNNQVLLNSFKLKRMAMNLVGWIEPYFKNNDSCATIDNFEYLIYKWALGNSLSLFLDLDINNLEKNFVDETIQILHQTLESTDKTEIQTDKWLKHPDKCPHYRMLANSQEFLYKFVSSQVDSFAQKDSSDQYSYLSNWLHQDKIHRNDVITFIIDALMAGLHTTSYTILFLLKNIAGNERLQKVLQNERSAEQMSGGIILKDCLRESMRLDPVSIGTGRLISQENICLRNFSIPINTMLITQNQTISRDEKIYKDAKCFRPERWPEYRALPRAERPSPFATLPFGFGARACIGQRLAELQIKIMAAELLHRFKIEFLHEIPVRTRMIHTIAGPVGVKLTRL